MLNILKNKKFRILIVLILLYFLLEISLQIVRYNHTTYAETEDGCFQIFAIDDSYDGYSYVWRNINMEKDDVEKIENLKISVLNNQSELIYTVPLKDRAYKPILKKPDFKNSVYTGLSLRNENLEAMISIDYPSPKVSITNDSEEYWRYKIEYEYDGQLIEEEIKPKRMFRIPDDSLLEILISYLL